VAKTKLNRPTNLSLSKHNKTVCELKLVIGNPAATNSTIQKHDRQAKKTFHPKQQFNKKIFCLPVACEVGKVPTNP